MLVNKNVERGRATRAHLIEVATRLFTAHGYDGTSIEAVQAESGVSRGSLYHHFPGKEALFLAVLAEVGAGITRQGEDAARDAADPVALLRTGGLLWIRNAGDPVVRQIMLIDGPTVLGWQRWRALDEQGAARADQGLPRVRGRDGPHRAPSRRRVRAHRAGRGQRGGHDGRARGRPGRGAGRRRERVRRVPAPPARCRLGLERSRVTLDPERSEVT